MSDEVLGASHTYPRQRCSVTGLTGIYPDDETVGQSGLVHPGNNLMEAVSEQVIVTQKRSRLPKDVWVLEGPSLSFLRSFGLFPWELGSIFSGTKHILPNILPKT